MQMLKKSLPVVHTHCNDFVVQMHWLQNGKIYSGVQSQTGSVALWFLMTIISFLRHKYKSFQFNTVVFLSFFYKVKSARSQLFLKSTNIDFEIHL